MKNILILSVLAILFGCTKTLYIPVETVRTRVEVVRDTVIDVKLVPIRDSVSTLDTFSLLSNKYAYSSASFVRGRLNHSLVIKDVKIPIEIKYVETTIHDTASIVIPISKADKKKIDGYDELQESNKSKASTIWKLIGALALCGLWIFRKPLLALIK